VVIPSASSARRDRPLADSLVALAGTPDDESSVPDRLQRITRLAADLLPPVAYASMTGRGPDGFVTVAMSSELALAVDKAQYADDTGPCLDVMRSGVPEAVPEIDATVNWPGFREQAHRLGLRASLSFPIFAGRGVTIAALNLYSHDSADMAPLSVAVLAAYDSEIEDPAVPGPEDLDPGSRQLMDGLTGAFAVRTTIQRALGVIMAEEHATADVAYVKLRSRAAATGLTLTAAAAAVLTRAGGRQRPA
jgi:hypothetical protein